jgi:2-polyprenyl-3-methyl-5-hydroxy-6-metoxy-1,4-benzoquinol methylase
MHNRYAEYNYEDGMESCSHDYIFPKIFRIIKELKLKSDLNILDAGCGKGELINVLHQLGFNNAWGFDASESAISLIRKSLPESSRFFKHDAYESKLPEGILRSYDLVFSIEVVEHLYSPSAYLQNIYSWLKKDGYLIITTPYHGFFKNLLIAITNKFDWHCNTLREGGHIKFFSKNTLSSFE